MTETEDQQAYASTVDTLMTTNGFLHYVAAFAETEGGGNPAGVWVGEELPSAGEMQAIAAEVGYSETAFVAPLHGAHRTVRYFSPETEVPFCGHATIAAGFVIGGDRALLTYTFATPAGDVPVTVRNRNGRTDVSLTSVDTVHRAVDAAVLDEALATLALDREDLDPAIPAALAFAGAWHLVLAVAAATRLANLDYDFDRLKKLMLEQELTTLQLVWRESDERFHARNPFPVGGVIEDPATGAAAAALGGYLRDRGIIRAPFSFEIRQGEAMGRPSLLSVDVPAAGGVVVTGTAARIQREL